MRPAEQRRFLENRVAGGAVLVDLLSAVKWAIYPWLVRFAPSVAIAIHEREATGTFWRAIGEGMIIVDGGAHRGGGYTLLGAKRAGSAGRVYAFEPEPENFRRLSRRVAGQPNIVPVQRALGRRSGSAELGLDRFHGRHSLTRKGGGGSVTVSITSLDDFVREHSLPGVDVVKLDIEGGELDAIAGMAGVLSAPRRPVVLCELHPPHTPEQFRDALAAYGYRCELLDAQYTGRVHDAPVHLLATAALSRA